MGFERAGVSGVYTIDPLHSRMGFVARHAMITKVRGSFTEFTGDLTIDETEPARSTGSLPIVAKSISTGVEQRGEHLRGNDFFDMAQYPELRFSATEITPVAGGSFQALGDLTIKGVTKPVTLNVEYTGAADDPMGNSRIGFEASATINRKDWGITWNAPLEAGGVMVSEKIGLDIDISAIREPA